MKVAHGGISRYLVDSAPGSPGHPGRGRIVRPRRRLWLGPVVRHNSWAQGDVIHPEATPDPFSPPFRGQLPRLVRRLVVL